MIIGAIIGLLIAAAIGAAILRGATGAYNSYWGNKSRDGSVPEPEFGHAMTISVCTLIVQGIVNFIIDSAFGDPGAREPGERNWTAALLSVPAGLVVLAGMLTIMLPTTFPRAIVIAVCYYVILIVIGVTIVAFMAVLL